MTASPRPTGSSPSTASRPSGPWQRDPRRAEDRAADSGTGDEILPLRRVLTWDTNSWRHLVFLAATGLAAGTVGPWGLLLYPALHLAADVLYYAVGVAWFDPSATIRRGYQVGAVLSDSLHSQGLDYGFNFYDGDFSKDRAQAQQDKFEHAWKQLRLQPGMRLMDVGCGCGDWLAWVRSRGVEVMGVNITPEQAAICRSRGLDVIVGDWKVLARDEAEMTRLEGRFDCVTFWDTVEHYVPMQHRAADDKRDEIYTDMFRFAARLQKPDSPAGRVFISCLHMRQTLAETRSARDLLRKVGFAYLLDKFHSGCYPSASRDCLVRNARPWFHLAERKDTTMDYYMTSVLEPSHFGRLKFRWTAARVAYLAWLVVADPFWLHRYAWLVVEDWMAQFDRDDINRSAVVHYWLTLDRQPAPAAGA